MFDPQTHMARCTDAYGHPPAVETKQNITDALKQEKRKVKRAQFQSDFRFLWGMEQ
jgi:hypothetical protein